MNHTTPVWTALVNFGLRGTHFRYHDDTSVEKDIQEITTKPFVYVTHCKTSDKYFISNAGFT